MATLSGIITPTNVLTESSTATLTNKTINGDNNTVTNIDLAGDVKGTLPIANGGTGLTALGTANQILSVNSGATALEYIALPSGSEIIRVARTSNTALTPSNRGNLIDITSGTFTQTFNAAATLTDGWFCYIRNSGTGDITLDPNSSETIDGLTSYIMYPGEVRLIQCNGTDFTSIVLRAFDPITITSSLTFTVPPGCGICVEAWGGGGSGRGGGTVAGGGAGGQYVTRTFGANSFGSTISIVVGAGGAAPLSANGNDGGNTTFGSLLTAHGGLGGTNSAVLFAGNTFKAVTAANDVGANFVKTQTYFLDFGFGGHAAGTTGVLGTRLRAGSDAFYGGAGGGAINTGATSVGGVGGVSFFGGNGGDASGSVAGDGQIPAGGGGGCAGTDKNGGAGARGELRIWGVV
jgi:hypothetical protein